MDSCNLPGGLPQGTRTRHSPASTPKPQFCVLKEPSHAPQKEGKGTGQGLSHSASMAYYSPGWAVGSSSSSSPSAMGKLLTSPEIAGWALGLDDTIFKVPLALVKGNRYCLFWRGALLP